MATAAVRVAGIGSGGGATIAIAPEDVMACAAAGGVLACGLRNPLAKTKTSVARQAVSATHIAIMQINAVFISAPSRTQNAIHACAVLSERPRDDLADQGKNRQCGNDQRNANAKHRENAQNETHDFPRKAI